MSRSTTPSLTVVAVTPWSVARRASVRPGRDADGRGWATPVVVPPAGPTPGPAEGSPVPGAESPLLGAAVGTGPGAKDVPGAGDEPACKVSPDPWRWPK